MSVDCLFCKIARGEIPSQKVLETDRIYAFRDITPQAPTHVLVIPKTHTASITDCIENDIFADVLAGVRDVAAFLQISDFRVVVNNGAEAGQSVFHLHAHLLAGRPLDWPPG